MPRNPYPAAVCVFTLGVLAANAAHAQVPLSTVTAGDSLSLEATVRAVLDANPSLNALQEEANQAQARLSESRTTLRPVISGTATYTRVDPVVRIALPGSTEELPFQPNNNYDVHVGGQYTLLDFGRRGADIDLVRSRTATAQDNLDLARRDLRYRATQNYYGILFAREAIRVQDQQIASLESHRREMQQRVTAGVSTNYDVTTTQVRITQAQNRKIDLQNQLRNQEVQLRRLLHLSDNQNVPVRGRLTYSPQAIDVTAALIKGAENRLEVRQAKNAERTAVAQQRVAEASQRPTLNVLAQAGAKNGYIVPNVNTMRFNTVVGAQLNVPIYDGHKREYRQTEAIAGVKAVQARAQDTQEQIRAEVRQAVNNLQASAELYDNARAQIEQATEVLTRAQGRYRNGVGSNLDVLDSETQLEQARLARAQAIYNYTLAQYELRRATGEE